VKAMSKSKANPKLVALDSGERIECCRECNDGVWTDAGLIPWEWVDGFWCWHAPIGRYLFIPK